MPTVLNLQGKLYSACFRFPCASQDMTHSWPSQQPSRGNQVQRFLYSHKDVRQHRQPRGEMQPRLAHPHVAPHKSMLADDLKLSSDEEDTDTGSRRPASWDDNSSPSTQLTHTHGGRVRHSSSDTSAFDSSSESESSSQHSRSPSPETHCALGSPANTQPLSCTKETVHPSTTQWQLDKWLKKVRKKSANCEQNPSENTQNYQGSSPSLHTHKAPSPARSWENRLDYSPSQSPIPSPQFNYSPRQSPGPSPGYSFCPSPIPSTYPSPCLSASPGNNCLPSPVPSSCPSPCGSTRASRSPSPVNRPAQRTPSPSLPPSSAPLCPRVHSPFQESSRLPKQPNLTTSQLHKPKVRPWIAPVPNIDAKSKARHFPPSLPPLQCSSASKTTHAQDQSQSKTKVKAKTTLVVNTILSHDQRQKSRPSTNTKPISHQPLSKHPPIAPKEKHLSHTEQSSKKDSRPPSHPSRSNPRPCSQPNSGASSNSAPRPKLLPAKGSNREDSSKTTHCSKLSYRPPPSTSKTATHSGTVLSSRSSPNPRNQGQSKESPFPTAAQLKLPHRSTQFREPEVGSGSKECAQGSGRKRERKEERHKKRHSQKQERQEERRLAEEQLLRRPWVQSSEGEEEEEKKEKERESRREGRDREEKKRRRRRKEQQQEQQRGEWQAVQPKQRPHTNSDRHLTPTDAHLQGRSKKRRSEGEKQCHPDPSPAQSHFQTPQIVISSSSSSSSTTSSSSSISSSDSGSESDFPDNISKVPADSTSHRSPVPSRRHQGPGRPEDRKSKVLHTKGSISVGPGEGQESRRKQKLYTLVPFGRNEKTTAPSSRGLRDLVVQFDLSLLHRVPDTTTGCSPKPPSHSSSWSKTKPQETMRHLYHAEAGAKDSKRKRKSENMSHRESKRSNGPLTEKETSDHKRFEEDPLIKHNGYLKEYLESKRPLSPLSPLSDTPDFTKPTVKTQHYPHKGDITVKPKLEVECVGMSGHPQLGSWGTSLRRTGEQKRVVPSLEPPHHAEYYMHEAKRMKHRADAMVDKLGKAVNYVDAALSFMECGKAMEEGPLEAKSPYTMYSETVELIRYAMRLKSHTGPGARQEDKQLAVLCFRCLALLYWQMFRLKKDHALKYSKALLDYFKSSPKVPTTALFWSDSGKATGGPPSLLSSNPPPSILGSQPASAPTSLISIPQRIHQMAANHLNITNSVLYSYEYWEVADSLAKDNKEFFNYLNTLSGPLTLHSTVAHAVQYTRQALQWIRISANLN